MTFTINDSGFLFEIRNIFTLFYPHEKMEQRPPARGEDGFQLCYDEGTVSLEGQVGNRTYRKAQNAQTRQEAERLLCRMLYDCLSDATGRRFPWGILTGIRPVKMLEKLTARGLTEAQALETLGRDYLVQPEKLSLLKETARNEMAVAARSTPDSYCLYLAIPFCKTRCSYCSFVSHSIDKAAALIEPYLDRMCEELADKAQMAKQLGLTLRTIYIGGGTPTVLSAPQLKRLTDAVRMHFPVDTALEYTCEAGRPDTISRDKLEVLKAAGVTRVSINPQSLNDEVLCAIGRSHTAQQVLDCFQMAREVGFPCINMDLIAGLPMESLESHKHTLETVLALRPENITVHTLTEKRASTITQQGGAQYGMGEQEVEEALRYGRDRLAEAGYVPYYMYRQKNTRGGLENVGYCLPGKEGLYNVFIMNETHSILAVGAGAVTKLKCGRENRIERVFNFKYPYEYIDRFAEVKERGKAILDFYRRFPVEK